MTVYFLGEGLEGVEAPVLIDHSVPLDSEGSTRNFLDVATGDEVRSTDPFVEALDRDAVVVQINRLRNRGRTDLERLLEVFDQGRISRSYPHRLDILEADVPERHRVVLDRLIRAGAEREILEKMDLEDDILAHYKEMARELADLRQAQVEQDKVIEKRVQVIKEKDRLIAELDRRISRA